jgi:hypothetical protein
MDEVLCHALRLDDPESFKARLAQPILPPDVKLDSDSIPASGVTLDDQQKVH